MKSEIIGLFSTPVYQGSIDNYDEVQDELDTCIKDINFGMRDGWSSTHYLSDPYFQDNLIIQSNLDKFHCEINNHIKEYCRLLNLPNGANGSWQYEYSIISSWFALFKKGNYAHVHNHGDCDIAGVYYFRKSNDDGSFFFTSPVPAQDSSCFRSGRVVINPNQGDILLFPGWLNHGVETNDTDQDRCSISFNISFERDSNNKKPLISIR
tara:strand:- start:1955 stop:2581 length:627 start_codon:yes stop_codon:yes gene_type:complete